MGRKTSRQDDKNKLGHGHYRNNPVYKTVGGRAGKKSGSGSKPQAVDVKLRKIKKGKGARATLDAKYAKYAKRMNKKGKGAIATLDAKYAGLNYNYRTTMAKVRLPEFSPADPKAVDSIVEGMKRTGTK